jgi:hypothetical protein
MTETDILKRLFRLLESYYRRGKKDPFIDYRPPGELQALLQLDRPGE